METDSFDVREIIFLKEGMQAHSEHDIKKFGLSILIECTELLFAGHIFKNVIACIEVGVRR